MISTIGLKACACSDEIPVTQESNHHLPPPKKKNWNQKVVPLDVALERRTMTSIPEISAPDQTGRDRNVGR